MFDFSYDGCLSLYSSILGHKKAIGTLLNVSPNRITEWIKIWNAANNKLYTSSTVLYMLSNSKKTSLKSFINALPFKCLDFEIIYK